MIKKTYKKYLIRNSRVVALGLILFSILSVNPSVGLAEETNKHFRAYLYESFCDKSVENSSSSSSGNGVRDGSSLSAKIGNNSSHVKTFIDTVKDLGFSGEHIAAAIACGARESGWDPSADNGTGAHGIFQWLGGRRTADINSNNINKQIAQALNELKTTNAQTLNGGAYNGDVYKGFSNELHDKTDALMSWSIGFEGVSYNGDSQTSVANIEKWYDDAFVLFPELKNIKGDQARLKAMVNSASATISANSSAGISALTCEDDGESGGQPDGTGVHTSPCGVAYLPSDLPNDLKGFITNPESLGMSFGSSTGWKEQVGGGQCTDFSRSFITAYSGIVIGLPNGGDVTSSSTVQAALRAKKSTIPAKFSVFSSSGVSSAGHTGIVEHVFANGDFLIVEQNSEASGDTIGKKFTWNYRIISKDARGYSFLKIPEKN